MFIVQYISRKVDFKLFILVCHSLECLDWVNIEKVIMHIVNVSLESEEANNCNQERK